MGRKSRLNEKQWAEIQERMLGGEAVRALAREFDVSEGSIRAKKTARVKKIKAVAVQAVAAECAIKSLDLDAQQAVNDLASRLRAVSSNLMSAAYNGSIVSSRLSSIAVKQAEKIDSDDPMENQEEMQAIAALTKLGIDSAFVGLNLMKTIKEDAPSEPDKELILNIVEATKPDAS